LVLWLRGRRGNPEHPKSGEKKKTKRPRGPQGKEAGGGPWDDKGGGNTGVHKTPPNRANTPHGGGDS